MSDSDFDPLAVLVVTVVSSALGAAWYSPALFGNAWLAAIGKTGDELGAAAPAIGGSVVACLVTACAVEYLVGAVGANSIGSGAGLGLLLGLAIVATAMLSDALFSGWGTRLFLIQAGYRVTYLVIMGAVCGAWLW